MPEPLRRRSAAFVALLALMLGACGSEKPAPPPQNFTAGEADTLPVMGPERRIVVVATGALDGRGLAQDERYPNRLEVALRAHGINARIVAIRAETPEALAQAVEALGAKPDLALLPSPEVAPALLAALQRQGIAVHALDSGQAGGLADIDTLVAVSAEEVAMLLGAPD